ncbi:nucleic acid-binding protein [Fistulina hepatica ATCC 64428]|uniref:Nucleic acid-binding protein n=1 Tax=Fistulina hepatica ATCC 64428 TaxID=1128425 RepID=A0A0D7AI05_9AGAR|nr:nucleic acid-binding protein [Fistulina hepatica ATCC 64428]
MSTKKRGLEDSSSTRVSKKKRTDAAVPHASSLTADEVDFPRGGGTSFTPVEVKAIHAEAQKEAREDVIATAARSKKRKRNAESKSSGVAPANKQDKIRIEHLNYKRLTPGSKIMGRIVSVHPLALVVSLPFQLLGHVPLSNVSSQLTSALEAMDEEDGEEKDSSVPELSELFRPGQYVRALVTEVHQPGTADVLGLGKLRDDVARASRRVELSLIPEKVNAGLSKSDIKAGFALSAAIQSVEDHGYMMDLGLPDMRGFLSFDNMKDKFSSMAHELPVGALLDVMVSKVLDNGRACNVVVDSAVFASSCLTEVTNVSSVLPGTLVQSLVTSVSPTGINVQILGFFDGTIDPLHVPHDVSEKSYKSGKKIKARVLYKFSSSPPRFALALNHHIVKLSSRRTATKEDVETAYPTGRTLESVKIVRVEPERGLIVEVEPGLEGFVHISHVSDDYVPSLSATAAYKIGTSHRARLTGHFLFDGILQLSLKPSVINRRILRVQDVQVGEVLKGTIESLTDKGLFVSIEDALDGIIRPIHFSDVALKHPEKKFKVGATIKCRVLVVDQERNRVGLTAKKSLVDSELPMVSRVEDARVGTITHATVVKATEKHLIVEFYSSLKVVVPAKELRDTNVLESFPVGKVIKIRIVSVDHDSDRIVASVHLSPEPPVPPVTDVEIGDIVNGKVKELHQDNVLVFLVPSGVRALLSINNLANARKLTAAQIRVTVKSGDDLENLVVLSRNPEKGIVIVANKPKEKPALPPKQSLSLDMVEIGQHVVGRVLHQTRFGALLKINSHITGLLHPTDVSDDYDTGTPFPAADSVIKAAVISVDKERKQLLLSTRPSRVNGSAAVPVKDHEIVDFKDLRLGATVRGFVKSVAEHGLFVTVGRRVDARVQIKELFDDFIKDWKPRFKENQVVKGRVLSLDDETKKVELTFRSEAAIARSSKPTTMTAVDLVTGQKIIGVVQKVETYGLFIKIEDTKLTGLCHKSELSDTDGADVMAAMRGFQLGDKVKAVVIAVDKNRISLSLKPSHFDDADFQKSDDEPVEQVSNLDAAIDYSDEDNEAEAIEAEGDADQTEEEEKSVDVDMSADTSAPRAAQPSSAVNSTLTLDVRGGFQWSAGDTESAVSEHWSSDEGDEDDQPAKKRKRRRKGIEYDFTADMQTRTPESTADFERVLLGSPNSSYLWIQYMSFQLQLSEVEKARAIGRRALQTINFREEREKLNVWIALLNIENLYGTDENLDSVFKEAARANDSKTVHIRLASVFEQTQKFEKAEEQYKKTCKKFGQSSKVWTLFAEFCFRRGNDEHARQLLSRSLQSLDKRKHLKTISRFAQLEYKMGDAERGRTVFEGIVNSHPKRFDLWSVYIDMEVGKQNVQHMRNLFDRVLAVKMNSHKARTFFKKWLNLEKRIGDDSGVETVKSKAVTWMQNINADDS